MKKENVTLSKNGIATIQRCEHGTVHIHFRCFTLRLTEDAFSQFASIVGKASSHLMDLGIEEMLRLPEFEQESLEN